MHSQRLVVYLPRARSLIHFRIPAKLKVIDSGPYGF